MYILYIFVIYWMQILRYVFMCSICIYVMSVSVCLCIYVTGVEGRKIYKILKFIV